MKQANRAAARIIFIFLAAYLMVTAYMYTFQRSFIYFPSRGGILNPSHFGAPYEATSFASLDGTQLNAWWIPQSQATTLPIALVYCHGNGADLSSLAHVAAIFHSYGLPTLMFEYRSYGKSQSAPLSEEGVVLDTQAAIRWVRTNHPTHAMILWGHSLGGAVAAHAASRERVEGLILENPLASVPAMARYRYPFLPIIDGLFLDRFDAVQYVRNLQGTRLLFLQAENDEVIPPAISGRVFDAAITDKQLITIAGAGHNDFPDVHQRYRELILDWVKRVADEGASSSSVSTSLNAWNEPAASRAR